MLALHRSSRGILLVSALLVLGACDAEGDDAAMDGAADSSQPFSCDDEARADAFTVDLSKVGEGMAMVTIFDAMPAVPTRGDNVWTVGLADASGAAMPGATLDVRPWMPDHGHGSPVQVVTEELGDGQYEITPLNLFMAGYWEITINVSDAEGGTDSVVFAVCVE